MTEKPKNRAAQALGRLGGKAQVPKGFAKLTREQRAAISRKGVAARRAKIKKP
jgi:hypothetical protein